jgi:hypothetical protein
LGTALPAYFLTRILWPPAPGVPEPTGAQLPLFILLNVLEVLTFGLGIAFTAFGLPLVRRAAGNLGLSPWPAYVAIAWSLVSWWPHDSLHVANGLNLGGLLLIEYGFHVTLYAAGLIVAWYFLATLRGLARADSATPRRARPTNTLTAA